MATTIRRPRNSSQDSEPNWEEVIAESFVGDTEMFGVTAAAFLESAVDYWTRIEEAVQKNSPDELTFAAHKLKGALQNFGPSSALDIFTEIELAAKRGTVTSGERLRADARTAYDQFILHLRKAAETYRS